VTTTSTALTESTFPSSADRPPVLTPSRFGLARRRRGYTKKHVAEQAGVSVRSISAYESGQTIPGPDTLAQIAAVLDFPIAFFEGEDLAEITDEAASFRSLARMTASQRHAAQATGTLALTLHDWIADRFRLPDPDVPQVGHGVTPETAADVVRTEWRLGDKPIANLVHLLEAKGVRIFSLAQECHEVDAFSLWHTQPFMFLNTQKSAEHSRFDAAHELGHLVMHWHHESPQGKQVEREANRFASALLMPASGVLATAPRYPSLQHLIQAKRRWRVSVTAFAYRLHILGVLSDWQYHQLYIEMSKRGYRTKEPASMPRETSQVLNKVFTALRKEGVGKADIAKELRVHPRDLDQLVFNLAMVPIEGEGRQSSVPTSRRREHALRLV
jgi:Zn-dependent peptidase ImmA (M78 family)/transcriptional regulator with XRE-family HTH domain